MKVAHSVRSSAAGAAIVAAIMVPAAVVLLVAACGSSSGATTAPTPSGPSASAVSSAPATPVSWPPPAAGALTSRTIVTRAEAGAALGQTVKPPVLGHATVEGGIAAVFYGPNAPAGANADVPVTDSVRVVLVTGPKALKYFDDYRSKVSAQPIAGLGDKAYYDGYASLSVLKGDEYLRIAVIGVKNVLGAEKTLAAAAVPLM